MRIENHGRNVTITAVEDEKNADLSRAIVATADFIKQGYKLERFEEPVFEVGYTIELSGRDQFDAL